MNVLELLADTRKLIERAEREIRAEREREIPIVFAQEEEDGSLPQSLFDTLDNLLTEIEQRRQS